MSNLNITFIDQHEATLHDKTLARYVAEALLFQIRIQYDKNIANHTNQPNTKEKMYLP